ncbi:MAG: peptidoglycan DD-metalloendopeptidase family protein [Candidatus Omnitrophica bacterium]|nr:peptidoglycan DD-metalloendopeptidase family protein [Candidatus Omnitrophota bacterium]
MLIKKLKTFVSLIIALPFVLYLLTLAGCVSAPYEQPTGKVFKPAVSGTYHCVQKGQTLWRISKIYDVDLDELTRINNLSESSTIEIGQKILIPGKKSVRQASANSFDDFIWPIKGQVVGSFGQTSSNMVNKGLNIKPYSDNNVIASRSGKVVFYSDSFGVYGKTVIIDHGDGFSSVYARNSEVYIKPGDAIEKGIVIAKAGSAGRDTNIYLHFEIRKGSNPQNPYYYLSD